MPLSAPRLVQTDFGSERETRAPAGDGRDAGWPSLAIFLFALATAAASVYGIRSANADLWGYLAYGRLFAEHGSPLVADPFAYTSAGHEWVAFEYLSQWLLWESFRLGGALGLIALKSMVGGLTLWLLFATLSAVESRAGIWLPVFAFAAPTIGRFFAFRPQLFSFAFFTLFVWVVVRQLLGRRSALWLLPPAMAAWANLHGGFLAGFAVLGVAILLSALQGGAARSRARVFSPRTRPLWICLLLSVPATLATPRGWRLWAYVLTEVTHGTNRRYIAEWRPTLLSGDAWSAVSLSIFVVLLVCLGVVAQRRGRSIAGLGPWVWLGVSAPFVAAGYLAIRHVPLAMLWLAPVATLFASALSQNERTSAFNRNWPIVAGFACVPAFLTLGIVAWSPRPTIETGGTVLGATHPCRAVAFLREHRLSGNLYTPLWWGNYASWELYPRVRVSMDGRNISLFSDEAVLENLRFYEGTAPITVPLRYPTDYLLVPADSPVMAPVARDRAWRQVFRDSQAGLFVRADAFHDGLAASPTLPTPEPPCHSDLR